MTMMTLKIDKTQITGDHEWHRQHQEPVGRIVHKDNPVRGCSYITSARHPLLQGTYTGVRTTILGNLFFPPFLTKTKRE